MGICTSRELEKVGHLSEKKSPKIRICKASSVLAKHSRLGILMGQSYEGNFSV